MFQFVRGVSAPIFSGAPLLTLRQKNLILGFNFLVLCLLLCIVLLLKNRQQIILFDCSDSRHLPEITQCLDRTGIDYEMGSDSITVAPQYHSQAIFALACNNMLVDGILLSPQSTSSLPAKADPGTYQSLENQLERLLKQGSVKIADIKIALAVPTPTQAAEASPPAADVQVVPRSSLTPSDVNGIRQLVVFGLHQFHKNQSERFLATTSVTHPAGGAYDE